MSKKKRTVCIILFLCVVLVLLIGIVLTNPTGGKHETIKEVMRDDLSDDKLMNEVKYTLEIEPYPEC